MPSSITLSIQMISCAKSQHHDKKKHWLLEFLYCLCQKFYLKQRSQPPHHSFWLFFHDFKKQAPIRCRHYLSGEYFPSPMIGAHGKRLCVPYWSFWDKIFQKILFEKIKTTFKHVIAPNCYHLRGPTIIHTLIQDIQQQLSSQHYHYVIKTDIASYYRSIDHQCLLQRLNETYHDKMVLTYLERIITALLDVGGELLQKTTGIPQGSVLSGFFSALYLKPLDKVFAKRPSVFYVRYNDDIFILCRTKRHYARAKRSLKQTVQSLKLCLSKRKTTMGALTSINNLKFLGMNFVVARTPQVSQFKIRPKYHVSCHLHATTIKKALVKAKLKLEVSQSPAVMLAYLKRWGQWWDQSFKKLRPT